MKITLEFLEPALISSGNSDGIIDVDISKDNYGIPFIGGKRFKGVLREAAQEVFEILNIDYDTDSDFNCIFGKTGNLQAGVKYNSFLIKDYANVVGYLEHKKEIQTIVSDYFTQDIDSTAIDIETGGAKDLSLRKYKAIKPGSFESEITGYNNERQKAIISMALLQLDRMGSRRNRGFGKLKCTINGKSINIEASLALISAQTSDTKTDTKQLTALPSTDGELCSVSVTIKTLAPVILANAEGEQNTVHSDSYFTGSRIKGIIAVELAKKAGFNLNEPITDETFNELLHSKLNFGYAYINQNQKTLSPTPLMFKTEKGAKNEAVIYNAFNHKAPSQTLGGFGYLENGKWQLASVNKSTAFHTSRNENRTAGRSTKAAGAIFYYEAIEQNQTFETDITGPRGYLDYLVNQLGNFETQIGKSSSSEYGHISINFGEVKAVKNASVNPGKYYLALNTPLILKDEFGIATCTINQLQKEFDAVYGINTVELDKSNLNNISRTTTVQRYSGVWRHKSTSDMAFTAGSTFCVTVNKAFLPKGLGCSTNIGFGNVQWIPIDVTPLKWVNSKNEVKYNVVENETTKNLLNHFNNREERLKIENKALEEASKYKTGRLSNSAISKLRSAIDLAKTHSDLKDLYSLRSENNPNGSPEDFINKLKNMNLLSKLERNNYDSFRDYQVYWTTYFKTIRLLNKRDKSNHDE